MRRLILLRRIHGKVIIWQMQCMTPLKTHSVPRNQNMHTAYSWWLGVLAAMSHLTLFFLRNLSYMLSVAYRCTKYILFAHSIDELERRTCWWVVHIAYGHGTSKVWHIARYYILYTDYRRRLGMRYNAFTSRFYSQKNIVDTSFKSIIYKKFWLNWLVNALLRTQHLFKQVATIGSRYRSAIC